MCRENKFLDLTLINRIYDANKETLLTFMPDINRILSKWMIQSLDFIFGLILLQRHKIVFIVLL